MPTRTASVNSFGYGGSNAHVVIQDAESFHKGLMKRHISSRATKHNFLDDDEEDVLARPQVLEFPANDEQSLKSYIEAIRKHLINPSISVKLADLAFTLSERRSRHFNRAFIITQSTDLNAGVFSFGKNHSDPPRIGFVFTGQGAQWS